MSESHESGADGDAGAKTYPKNAHAFRGEPTILDTGMPVGSQPWLKRSFRPIVAHDLPAPGEVGAGGLQHIRNSGQFVDRRGQDRLQEHRSSVGSTAPAGRRRQCTIHAGPTVNAQCSDRPRRSCRPISDKRHFQRLVSTSKQLANRPIPSEAALLRGVCVPSSVESETRLELT